MRFSVTSSWKPTVYEVGGIRLAVFREPVVSRETTSTKDIKKLTHEELLRMQKDIEEALSKRNIDNANKAKELVEVGDTVEICPEYGGEKRTGVVKKLLGTAIHVPGLTSPEYGTTPYYDAIAKIIRNGRVIFDRETPK
jgi:hypothetical protein